MALNFGNIKSYNRDRGFGFVGRAFSNHTRKVCFHMNKIKKEYPELAHKLDNGEAFKNISCWYEIETNDKREQVSKLWLNIADIPQNYTNELDDLTRKVESFWKNISSLKPSWLNPLTIELVGVERRDELSFERDNLELQKYYKYKLKSKAEADELAQLLAEMRPLNFTYRDELSKYIIENQLSYRYPNISGIVRMKEGDIEWNFLGGFSQDIYRIISQKLNLCDRGTNARAIGFTSFKDITLTNKI